MFVGGWRALIGALVIMSAGSPARAQAARASTVALGRQLFDGAIPFARGGPACASCHDTAGLPFPGGGTMGPDLTTAAARMGQQGIETALSTLYFPTMAPLFSTHPLTPGEQQALAAFLEQPNGEASRPVVSTAALGIALLAGCAILLAITGRAGRSRVHSVRLALLATAAAGRRAAR
ncbi:MAG: c-type cytochrome [Acidobacteria bacterium]|nr:c-type cytochrome [Acidobacteriota bacterium]